MRRRCAEATVFVCVFLLFLGYCEWWKRHSREPAATEPVLSEVYAAIIVTDAGDGSFNGVYEPLFQTDGICYFKADPDRFLWYDGRQWHLATEASRLADGYMGGENPLGESMWCVDGGPAPAPNVCFIPETCTAEVAGLTSRSRVHAPTLHATVD